MDHTAIELKKLKEADVQTVLELTSSSLEGLSTAEAIERSRLLGYNQISASKKRHPFLKLISYFKDPLILILIGAAAISSITGEIKSSVIIITMILLSVILNFYQENKSDKAADKIARRIAIKARVLRDGQIQEINTKYIVPGDIIELSAGDIVPADGKIITATDFYLNESSLTGESMPVEKEAEKNNILYSGTNVVSGFSRFVVATIGLQTEFGKIAERLSGQSAENAFEKGIRSFGFLIVRIIAIIVSIIFLINAFADKGIFESLLFALAVAVGVTPELLPMIMSVNMSRGAAKMAKSGVLVKKLNSIPTFGSMDILCTDKTGTLTQDIITVIKHVDIFGNESADVFDAAYINGYFETGIKSILDKAILTHDNTDISDCVKVEEVPYDFNRKRSSIIYRKNNTLKMVSKGAPEEIFRISSYYLDKSERKKMTSTILAKVKDLYDALSGEGLRILAIAEKDINEEKDKYGIKEECELTLIGLMAFYDPPKEDVKETLVFMREHGIEIKILTGDSALVTKKICEGLDLEIKGIVSGDELDLNVLSDEEVFKKINNATICARLSPSQKEKIISELKRNGFVVGYLGDGINDTPSLKTADIGISVDNAVDVAKETADIILLKKGLKELMEGVIEGRKTFGNTMKYLLMGLSSNFGNMFSLIGASIFLPFFPMTAGQILLNNFIYDNSQLAIPSDNVDSEYLNKPKHWNISFIKRYMMVFGSISSAFDLLTFYILFSIFHLNTSTFQAGWFIESLATQILVIHIIRTQKTPFFKSRPSNYLIISTIGAVALGFLLTVKKIGGLFGFSPLPLPVLLCIFILVAAYLITVEFTKNIFYNKVAAKIK